MGRETVKTSVKLDGIPFFVEFLDSDNVSELFVKQSFGRKVMIFFCEDNGVQERYKPVEVPASGGWILTHESGKTTHFRNKGTRDLLVDTGVPFQPATIDDSGREPWKKEVIEKVTSYLKSGKTFCYYNYARHKKTQSARWAYRNGRVRCVEAKHTINN